MSHLKVIIKKITQLTNGISAFRLEPANQTVLPTFEPGAHVDVVLPDGQIRAYSLIAFDAIPKAPDAYVIAVQLEPEGQGGARQMHEYAQGDMLSISAPKNDFSLDLAHPSVLLAGGIGITPMITMAAALATSGQAFRLHYAGRSLDAMTYRAELVQKFRDALYLHVDDEPETALDLPKLIRGIDPDAHLYICGPRGMLDAARTEADRAGIASDRIHIELFEAAGAHEEDVPFEVELASNGAVFTINPGQSIIEVLEEGGVDVMYDCQRGDCGICQCDVISGTPDHRDVVLSQAERDSGKVMQICVSRSKSPRLVLDM